MTNHDIDAFFLERGLIGHVERQAEPPSAMWIFQAGSFPIMIQTQEDANRMRIVAFITAAETLDPEHMRVLLEANYHSALDARYAVTGDHVVAAFLHPFSELGRDQFILGLYQVVSCAETYGTHFSGGTMVFDDSGGDSAANAEASAESFLDSLVDTIKNSQQQ